MDAERLRKIEEIYHAVLEIEAAGRGPFIEKVCGTDENLRREVESLLAVSKDSDQFLNSPPESLIARMIAEENKPTGFSGTKIGRYEIKKLLGKGGMGEVFLAKDADLERLVAIKILPPDFSNDSRRVTRFIREAKAASALNHPNILTIYEIGQFQNLRFIVTEYIEGHTLREKMTRETFDVPEILDIAAQIAAALSAAHSAGIVHRDIKPENLILRGDGLVKVLDFGLAKMSSPDRADALEVDKNEAPTRKPDLTKPGMIMGTTSYMSPEQIRGQADIDARADIWSLGVVTFEMLARRVPFAGETVSDIIASILKADAPHLSKCVDNCPAELERIVTKSLQKKRENRYQNVKDLALDLRYLKRDLEFSSEFIRSTNEAAGNLTGQGLKHTTAVEPAGRFSPNLAILISLAAVLLIGGGWWFFSGNNKTPEPAEAATFKTVEVANWSSTPGESYSLGKFSPDGKMIAFASTKTGGLNIWIKQTTSGEAVQITKDEFHNDQPIWSPNGEELAFFSTRGNQTGIWRMPVLGGSPKFVANIDDGSSLLRLWSKNNLIYYESENDLYAIDVNSGKSKQTTDFAAQNSAVQSMSISPDEQRIAYVTVEGETYNVWTKKLSDEPPKKLLSANSEIKNTIFHADNQRIFYSTSVDGTFQIFVTDINASPPKQITSGERDSLALDVSADGAKVLYGSAKEDSDIWSFNLKDGKESAIASEIDSELWANVSPDGKLIAYQSIKNLNQANNLFIGNILTKKLNSQEPPVQLIAKAFSPVWSPDGQNIAFMIYGENNKFQIFTIPSFNGGQKRLVADEITSPAYSILPYNHFQESDFSWSPDNSKIAYLSKRGGQYNIWLVNADGSNNTQLTANNDSKLYLYCPLWSPDGKQIAYTTKTGNSTKKPTYSIWIIDTEKKDLRMMTQQKTFFRLIEWMQTGKEILLVSTEESETNASPMTVSLFRLNTETNEMREIVKLNETYLYNIRLSPDKKNIAFAAHRDGEDNIWLIPAAGGTAKKLTGNHDARLYFSTLAWSPDNTAIFFGKQSRYSLLSMISNFK